MDDEAKIKAEFERWMNEPRPEFAIAYMAGKTNTELWHYGGWYAFRAGYLLGQDKGDVEGFERGCEFGARGHYGG